MFSVRPKHISILVSLLTLLLLAMACHQQPTKVLSHQKKAAHDSLIHFLVNNVTPLLEAGNHVQSRKILDSLKFVVEKMDYPASTHLWMKYMSSQSMHESRSDSAEFYLRRALSISAQADTSRKKEIDTKLVLATLFINQKKIDSALLYARDAYSLAKRYDTTQLPMAILKVVSAYSFIANMEEYKNYSLEGFRVSTDPRHKQTFAACINYYYTTMHMPDSALAWYRNMSTEDSSLNTPFFRFFRYDNTGLMLSYQNKDAEALQYQLKALEVGKEMEDMDVTLYLNLGITYHKLKRYAEAEKYLKIAIREGRRVKMEEIVTDAWKRTAQLYADQGKWIAALAAKDSAYKSFNLQTDSSFAGMAREIETRYAVKSKDEEIQTLAFTNEANRKIGAQQQLIIFILAGALILAAILGLALWRRRKISGKLRQAELEQRLLRSQMEPHFIFNTLSVLQSYIRNNESEKAVRYLNQFARLLRVTLENSRESFVPLEDEIAALENYLSLQSMRFEGVFDFEVSTWPMYEDERLLIPPMLLQPFVENAILHGMKQLKHKGHITVTVTKDKQVLHCIIEDNGTGLHAATTTQPDKRSLSTTITRERLEMLSRETGYPAGIDVHKAAGENAGTRVELRIPFRKAKPFSGSGEKSNGF